MSPWSAGDGSAELRRYSNDSATLPQNIVQGGDEVEPTFVYALIIMIWNRLPTKTVPSPPQDERRNNNNK